MPRAATQSADAELDPEDDALLLRAWQLRVGPLPGAEGAPLRYRHVAIDEVQDFSPLEVRVLLGCLDERQSITLAGDTQQHSLEDAGFTSWATFFAQLGLEGAEVNTLEVELPLLAPDRELRAGVLGPTRARTTPAPHRRARARRSSCSASPITAPASRSSPTPCRSSPSDEPLASVAVLTPSRELQRALRRGPRRRARCRALRRVERPGLHVRARRRGHRDRAGEGPRVRLRGPGRGRARTHFPDTPRRAPPAPRRRDARRAPALADLRRDARRRSSEPRSRADPEP